MSADEPLPPVEVRFAKALHHVAAVAKSKVADTGSYTYRYADLSAVLDSIKSACSAEGLTFSQSFVRLDENTQQIVTTVWSTDDGRSVEFGGPVFPIIRDPQAAGSAITYHRRYSLTALFALDVADDDGAQGSRAVSTPTERTPAEKAIRAGLAELDDDLKREFAAEFKERFGSTLTRLPENQHGDALTFWHAWVSGDDEADVEYTAADAAADTGEGY